MNKQTKPIIIFTTALISTIIFCLFMHYITNQPNISKQKPHTQEEYTLPHQNQNQKERISDNDLLEKIKEYNQKLQT
ncbi:hypothetical protein PA0160 [Candidatus Phytoplasma australiense]|uniref:Uncharacterized protein n=1 Tax=Phytoplasma australiense TaxID=59748 RepID=B1V963_PHYAS|nr:hypothetical protein PA0160 [Candidatus Phytoplasma australiense]